ncbi:MAG: hypothetical protein LUF30_10675 [Lachnospiraceae bacterium]|nr:hypothetical protein [Lachnospiraceae bacterium]
MKRKHFLHTLTILLALCLMAAFSMTALAIDERWESTTSRDEDGNICIDFAEVQVVLPSSWGGKVQMNISTDYVSFYHIGSRDAWTESLGYANGGHLFTIAYTEDDDYLNNPSYMVIGYTAEGTYYAWFPTDYQAWTGDSDIQSEYNVLFSDIDWVKANLTLTIETIIEIDSEYIFPESSTTYLTEDDHAALTADEDQIAIN